ncbi:hypothetical protein NSQ95_08910 [Psychrobacillus sp. FSL W7-1457]|uniref:hypothetical protein n=1 Tax=Psychrobacillus sp. FSL W7-1457 TaxID=2954547 RepID=UPI00315A12EB
MENQYTCIYDINKYRDAIIKFNGDGQELEFKFMIPFVSVPHFFHILLELWTGKVNKDNINGYGIPAEYYLTVEEKNLCVERLTSSEDSRKPIFHNYKFDFERFAKALDKGFSEYFQEQKNKGLYPLPLEVDEYSHHLSNIVIKKYEEFSTIINESELNMIRPVEEIKITLLDDVPAYHLLKSEKEGIEFLLKNDYKKVNGLGYYVVSFHGEGLEETVLQTVFDDREDAENCMELLVQRLENGHGRGILGI